jgi:hypothetical protein
MAFKDNPSDMNGQERGRIVHSGDMKKRNPHFENALKDPRLTDAIAFAAEGWGEREPETTLLARVLKKFPDIDGKRQDELRKAIRQMYLIRTEIMRQARDR